MELNRKYVTVILVALIIIIPVLALSWNAIAPSKVDSITLESVVPDEEGRDGVLLVGSASGSGKAFSGGVALLVFHEDEQVYSGKVSYRDGVLNQKLLLTEFATGNGEYEFKIIYEGKKSTYTTELDMVIEELDVISNAAYNVDSPPAGTQPWHALYWYSVTFKTGWNMFQLPIDAISFNSIDLGMNFIGNSTPLRVDPHPEHGVTLEIIFENLQGNQQTLETYDLGPGESLDTDYAFPKNGSYILKFSNDNTVPVTIKVLENRAVTIPRNAELEFQLELDSQTQDESQLLAKAPGITGYVRPTLGPGEYSITIAMDNPTAKTGSSLSLVSVDDTIVLNDVPRADTSAGEPYILNRAGNRAVTFDATASFDDGPVEDLYVYWSFGATSEGAEIGSAEGTWEEMKTYTYVYAVGETPDLIKGKPYLILKDAYGAESTQADVNLQIR